MSSLASLERSLRPERPIPSGEIAARTVFDVGFAMLVVGVAVVAVTAWASGIKLHDFNCGYKAYRREIMDMVPMRPDWHRFMVVIAAAHAACFSMALSSSMAKEGLNPESIDTTATVTFDKVNDAWTVTSSHLQTSVKSQGADPAAFKKAAEGAKAGCPISRLLNTTITMEAKLGG